MDSRATSLTAVQALIGQAGAVAWSTAAVALALSASTPEEVRAVADEVVRAGGIDVAAVRDAPEAALIGMQAAATLRQPAEVLGLGASWTALSDDVLLAQGRLSARGAQMTIEHHLPGLEGVLPALRSPGARMLDVGTGTAALAVLFAQTFPHLHVVGLDVWPRVLDLARREVDAAGMGDRVELRESDIAALAERDAYDLIWLPAPFVPEASLRAGAKAAAAALRPGAWMYMGHGRFRGDPVADATTRLQTVLFNETALDDGAAQRLFVSVGLTEVSTISTPPGAPALTVGRRPGGNAESR